MTARRRRPALLRLAVILTGILGMLATFPLWWDAPGGAAIGMMQRRAGSEFAAGTPVPVTSQPDDPLDGDPLDGRPGDADPLDGELASEDSGAPEGQASLAIARSGRPSQDPRSLPAYDGDPATVWRPASGRDESWIWLDLGAEQGVREVRWLAEGAGIVETAVSNDRRRWKTIERVEAGSGWHGTTLRDDVRFVRLMLVGVRGERPPALAEVAVYGRERGEVVSSQQDADGDRDRRRAGANRDDETGSRRANAVDADVASGASEADDSPRRRGGRVQISTEAGETRCSGDRERCRAQKGVVSVEEDCAESGSCIIDVRADGGTAICDATGGDESRAGRGEGRRGADGGSCEAVANGGAVAIGDINP